MRQLPSEQGPGPFWLYAEPTITAWGQRLPLPSLRTAVLALCLLVTVLQTHHVAATAAARRPIEFWGTPVKPRFAAPFGQPPPEFAAVAAEGKAIGPEVIADEGLVLVCFLTERCGACEFLLAQMDEVRAQRPDVFLLPVMTSGGRLDETAARQWCARHGLTDDVLFDRSGEWARSWVGVPPPLPYSALLVDGVLVWGEVGAGHENGLRAIVESWRATQSETAGTPPSLLAGLPVRRAGAEARVGELTREGLWVVTYGPRSDPGVQQRRAALTACRGPDGAPLSRIEIVTDGLPPPTEDGEEVWGAAMVVEESAGLLSAPPAEWMPYTEILIDGRVVYAETREAATRDVVIQAVAAARRDRP